MGSTLNERSGSKLDYVKDVLFFFLHLNFFSLPYFVLQSSSFYVKVYFTFRSTFSMSS